ncbi:sn-glycerol-3-phosphate import ATP-binding protein UgpC [Verticiella sediminum]|uniref:sn-glycerol-3-phosphate import ATP-binding protein UgpC n=1 Tax=Verticiella sediminum TaxID=1247510 RepID=A0A556AS50_9BURK|nr:sn-glycerol-3-phosphate import ATP-binding protein UgpC [Verticiella sediminum]TSH95772.1 sn-glycerol-3-phosphate import ATP-binding protein UgpC [Verticiella sediminum]
MANLSLRDVTKSYPGGNAVIHGISLEIVDGEFIVIVGPSGCGKSTLLRMVAGLESISSGEILIGGVVVNRLEPADRDVAMVFQNYALYPHMSVFENMAYGLKIRRFSKAEIQARVQVAADILELGPLLERRPRQLSGGQRQRVAMGRAIVREPKAFLFDEPLSNLDAKLRVQMRLEIQRLHKRLGTTSLYVTHDQVEAMTLGQRMVVMNKGRVEQVGTPTEVFEQPATTFVAGFIGSPPMNLVPVRVAADGVVHTEDGVRLAFDADTVPPHVRGRDVIAGLRPEHAVLGAPGLPLTVEMVETLGSEQLVHARCGRTAVVLRHATRVAAQGGPAAGDEVNAGPDSRHPLHWFDADSGRRLEV